MKTFDEAASLFFAKVEGGRNPSKEDFEKAETEIMANHSRYLELIEEIQNSDHTYLMAKGFLETLGDKLDAIHFVMAVISHSVPIGIEMERFDDGPTC